MSIRVKTRQGESVNQLLRRFKKLCEKEGLTKDIKRRAYFEKPSERRRRAQRKTIQRLTRVGLGPPMGRPTGGRPGARPGARPTGRPGARPMRSGPGGGRPGQGGRPRG
jgi:small subunit ribosomal protein S21